MITEEGHEAGNTGEERLRGMTIGMIGDGRGQDHPGMIGNIGRNILGEADLDHLVAGDTTQKGIRRAAIKSVGLNLKIEEAGAHQWGKRARRCDINEYGISI